MVVKKLAKSAVVSFASFLIVAYYYPGFRFERPQVLVVSAAFFAVLTLIVKPILKIFSLPLNLFTFGLFSFFSGAIVIYLDTVLVQGFAVVGYAFQGFQISGFTLPAAELTPIFSAVVASVLISWLNTALRWLFH